MGVMRSRESVDDVRMSNEALISYASGTGTSPLLGQTIGVLLDQIAQEFPEREALVETFSGRRWTFAELLHDVEALAANLIKAGIARGDRVGVWSPNSAEWVLVQYATAKIGAILVNVNPAYRTTELDYVIKQSTMRLMISATNFRDTDYAAMLAEINYHDVVFVGSSGWTRLLQPGTTEDVGRLSDRAAELTFDQPINIQYTSGTTGFPKGATLSHHNILNNGYSVGEGLHYTEYDRLCLPVPL